MTKILSFLERAQGLEEVELEIALLPGLPQIHILGLPDKTLQESIPRIKCALRKRGFQLPKAQQIIVNLRPGHLTHPSRGLDAAIAYGILLETEQISQTKERLHVYAEMNLDGDLLFCPSLIEKPLISESKIERLIAGGGEVRASFHFDFEILQNISQIEERGEIVSRKKRSYQRPLSGLEMSFSQEQAFAIQLFAVRPFHLLLAGAPGSGKSTLMNNISSFLPEPDSIASLSWGPEDSWWPMISPHASVTKAALFSHGGVSSETSRPHGGRGEIFRADNGLLLLDELLEFKKDVLESLRSPLDGGEILVSRFRHRRIEQSKFVCVATTNLCPCGRWVPGRAESLHCGYTALKCRSTSQKLSGPVADRFQGIIFLDKREGFHQNGMERSLTEGSPITGHEILTKLQKAWAFQASLGGQSPISSERPFSFESLSSRRRSKSLDCLAQNAALLDLSPQPQKKHWEIAYKYSIENFELLSRGPC